MTAPSASMIATSDDLRRDLGQVGERLGSVHGPEHTAGRAASAIERRLSAAGSVCEVLRRPRHAPRGDDRLLRAALVRAAALPLARRCSASRTRPTRARSSCASCSGRSRARRSTRSCTRCAAIQDNAPRSASSARVPALVVALALQRARERVQHRLRPPEPRLPARQGARDDDDGRLARRRSSRRSSSARSARSCCSRYAGFVDNASVATRASRSASRSLGIFVFLATAYYVLTNATLTWREVLPGAVVGGGVLEATFQLLPEFVVVSRHNPVLQALSWQALLLVWLYVMANVTVLGAEVNWYVSARRRADASCRATSAGPSRGHARYASSRGRVERLRRAAAVRVLALPVVAELGDRPRLAARDEDRVVAEAARRRGARARSRPRARRCRAARSPVGRERDELGDHPRARGSARRPAARAARPPGRRPAPSAPSAAPGAPPSASHSMPESSPSTHSSGAARLRPKRAFSSAFSSYVAPVSSGQSSATSGSISQPGSAASQLRRACARSARRSARASALPPDPDHVLEVGDARRRAPRRRAARPRA